MRRIIWQSYNVTNLYVLDEYLWRLAKGDWNECGLKTRNTGNSGWCWRKNLKRISRKHDIYYHHEESINKKYHQIRTTWPQVDQRTATMTPISTQDAQILFIYSKNLWLHFETQFETIFGPQRAQNTTEIHARIEGASASKNYPTATVENEKGAVMMSHIVE